ncbi:MAG: hypothetical protein NTX61_12140 [Bacteroidetes bacterium]|nr:hypothetical protein [Bacteroidota bacterium]
MKKNLTLHVVFFLTGVIIGALIVILVCCPCKHHCWMTKNTGCKAKTAYIGVATISSDSANKCFRCYLHTPYHVDTLFAYKINMLQFHAMQLLAASDTSISGFRIYPGIHGDPQPVSSIVSTDLSDKDNTGEIYSTSSINSGPCPTSCDAGSPIPSH